MNINIKCRPLHQDPIAHELIYNPKHERTVQNAFRFVFMSYIQSHEVNISEVFSTNANFGVSNIRHNLYLSDTTRNSVKIRADIVEYCCKVLKIDFSYLYQIAIEFSKNTSYNAINFAFDKSVIFFKGFKHTFGH